MFRFSKKLKGLKPSIRNLSREKLGDLPRRAKEAYASLCEKQGKTLLTPSDTEICDEAEAYAKWKHVAELEEAFYKQKYKLHWLHVGDQNNKVFHNAVRLRETKNAIREIQCDGGSILSNQEDIKHEAARFFSEFLTQVPANYAGIEVNELQKLLTYRCSGDSRVMLEKEVTTEEVKKVLFSMPTNKSPNRMAIVANSS